jgi:hypothetical protein
MLIFDETSIAASSDAQRGERDDGGRGIAAIAISALDIALWDLKAHMLECHTCRFRRQLGSCAWSSWPRRYVDCGSSQPRDGRVAVCVSETKKILWFEALLQRVSWNPMTMYR